LKNIDYCTFEQKKHKNTDETQKTHSYVEKHGRGITGKNHFWKKMFEDIVIFIS